MESTGEYGALLDNLPGNMVPHYGIMLDELLWEDGRWRLRINDDANMVLYQVTCCPAVVPRP